MPAYCASPSAPTNPTLHKALDLIVAIACGDVAVFPGDVFVGGMEGVKIISAAEPGKSPGNAEGWRVSGHSCLNRRQPAIVAGLHPATKRTRRNTANGTAVADAELFFQR